MKAQTGLTTLFLFMAMQVPVVAQMDVMQSAPPVWEQFRLDSNVRVPLNFRNVPADVVIQALSRASGIAMVKDPTLNAPLTLQSPAPQPLKAAFAMLNASLTLRNFEIRKEGNFLVIRPKAQRMAFAGMPPNRNGVSDGNGPSGPGPAFGGGPARSGAADIVLRIYSIKYANASQVARVINEVFASTSTANANQNGSASDDNGNGPDNGPGGPGFGPGGPGFGPGGPGGGPGGQGFGPGGPGGGPGGPVTVANIQGGPGDGPPPDRQSDPGDRLAVGSSPVRASSDDFSNTVIVNASARSQVQIEKVIGQIDKQTQQSQHTKIFVLRYATASQLTAVIQNVLVSNAPLGRGGAGTQNASNAQRFQQAAQLGAAQSDFGTVVADTRTNTLVVTATQDNLDIVGKVLERLDTPVKYATSTFILTLKNARADAVAQILNQALSSSQGNTSSLIGGAVNSSSTSRTTTSNSQRSSQTGGPQGP